MATPWRKIKFVAAFVTTLPLCLLAVGVQITQADPCGMVPPITASGQSPLVRTGEQKTYVGYHNGVETMVLRPGFSGRVEDFGMLIPFPTPPAIRKVPDHIFPHIAAAVDPPEIVVDMRIVTLNGRLGAFNKQSAQGLRVYRESTVRVLREEAVGMYEVAVLEAGSADALKKWLEANKYRYPDGMDKPCNDYVEAGWCFVAIKTRMAAEQDVDAKPGQRDVNDRLPKGGAFDGHVQAMGFRFHSEKLVVPMRLSAFNDGELRNIVYLLTDSPKRVRAIPEEYVVRQISGTQLRKNLTEPLPVRIIGGDWKDVSESRRTSLKQEREPSAKNGAAKELFASDLLSATTGKLNLAHEEEEKQLLNIGERLGLRGEKIDRVNTDALETHRSKVVAKSLAGLEGMTLTVVDGDFPREVIAGSNLTFGEYKMPANRNTPAVYDAKRNGPAQMQTGKVYLGDLPKASPVKIGKLETPARYDRSILFIGLGLLTAFVWLTFKQRN